MIYTKEEFKQLWGSNNDQSIITYKDISDCALEWSLITEPVEEIIDIALILDHVLQAAGITIESEPDNTF